jgi:hypothetical protein
MIRLIVTLYEVTYLVTTIAIRERSFQDLRHLQVRMPMRRHALVRFNLQQNDVCFWRMRHADTAKPNAWTHGTPRSYFAAS